MRSNDMLLTVAQVFTLGRATVGTTVSFSSALMGNLLATGVPEVHWLQALAWLGAFLAGFGTFIGMMVKCWIDLRKKD